ncbi:unnamed protein product [Caenorhabditis angaria]|uniref:Uncharacterized protein n=1 Tax=Caenorhabditis angaria TaxID=860376 RepID=A0A9P1J4S3_9PELO|nr:unnamed protein product [Caenorhabditis angaria]
MIDSNTNNIYRNPADKKKIIFSEYPKKMKLVALMRDLFHQPTSKFNQLNYKQGKDCLDYPKSPKMSRANVFKRKNIPKNSQPYVQKIFFESNEPNEQYIANSLSHEKKVNSTN